MTVWRLAKLGDCWLASFVQTIVALLPGFGAVEWLQLSIASLDVIVNPSHCFVTSRAARTTSNASFPVSRIDGGQILFVRYSYAIHSDN
jgi:hypothetical protein